MFGLGLLSGLLIVPLVGAAFILSLRGDGDAVRSNARWAALIATVATFLLSLVAWSRFDQASAAFGWAKRNPASLLLYLPVLWETKERLNNMRSTSAWAAAALSYFSIFGWGFTADVVGKGACVS